MATMKLMKRRSNASKQGLPEFFEFDPGDTRYNPTRSYFEGCKIIDKLQSDIFIGLSDYDEPFFMPPDWPGDEPVWAGVCRTCPWRYEGPQSKAIAAIMEHTETYIVNPDGTLGGPKYPKYQNENGKWIGEQHGVNYIHLGTCWHQFNRMKPLQYIDCQERALQMIKKCGRNYDKRFKFPSVEEFRSKMREAHQNAIVVERSE